MIHPAAMMTMMTMMTMGAVSGLAASVVDDVDAAAAQIQLPASGGVCRHLRSECFQLRQTTFLAIAVYAPSEGTGNGLVIFTKNAGGYLPAVRIPPRQDSPVMTYEGVAFSHAVDGDDERQPIRMTLQWRIPGNGGNRCFQEYAVADGRIVFAREYVTSIDHGVTSFRTLPAPEPAQPAR
jgi:hypothetical protein